MLSNLIVSRQKFVLIKDELGHERISQKFITQILKEQGEEAKHIKTLSLNDQLSDYNTIMKFLNECNEKPLEEGTLWNVVLPNLLKKSEYVKRLFLWISLPHLQHDHGNYVTAAFEYMADLVLHILTASEISLLTCKPGGGITFKHYKYTRMKSEIKLELKQNIGEAIATNAAGAAESQKEQLGTFKIELDEEEIVARNAIKMPYEKAMNTTESNIIYIPDAADDFDEEDPDEDLNI